jgi:hypothetical protein
MADEPAIRPAQPAIRQATPIDVVRYFARLRKSVLTFLGYSAADYEDRDALLRHAGAALDECKPAETVVNIGASAVGIGAVYEAARRRGFMTSGIVSSQAQAGRTPLSPHVEAVFFIEDAVWGGRMPGTELLSPTSATILAVSDRIVAIGGGGIARDELAEAVRLGKPAVFIPADMNHAIARARCEARGEAAPDDFRGSVDAAVRNGAITLR